MADKKVKVKVDVETNAEGSIAQLKELKKQLKETAAGSAEFKRLANEIDDLEDTIKGAKQGSADWIDTLESAGGPIGAIGGALNKAKVATVSFGTALKATGIGLIVAAVGGLVAAFSAQEGAMKKLQPLLIGMEKILGGIFAVFEPLLNSFLEMALQALPYITKGIGIFYSTIAGLFNLIKNVGVGVGQILKGIFTLDFDSVSAGYEKIKTAIPNALDAAKSAFGRYEEGTKQLTKTEKENLKERSEANAKALEEKKKQMEAQDKLDEAALEKLKAQALALAETDQQKLDIEKGFADKLYALKLKDLEDRLALEKKGSAEYKAIQAEITQLQADKIEKDKEFADKAQEITDKALEERKKKNEETLNREELFLQLQKEKGLIKEDEYQKKLYDLRVKYSSANEDLLKQEISLEDKFKKGLLTEEQYQQQLADIKKKYATPSDTGLFEEQTALQSKREQNLISEEEYQQQLADIKKKYSVPDITAFFKEQEALNQQREQNLITEDQYQQSLLELRQKYNLSNADVVKAEIDLQKYKNDEKKKLAEDERNIELNKIQSQLDDLDRANKQSELDFAQDLERLAQQKDLLAQQQAEELKNEDLTEFQKTEIRKKYSDARKSITDQEIATEKAAMQAKHDINMAYLGLFEQFGNVLQQVAGKNKGLAIAGVIISQAASIGQIIANTAIANAKSVAASPLTGGLPWVAINTISAGLSIASTIAAAVKSIQQINQAASQAGVKGGSGGSAASAAPQIAAPKVTGAAAPQINVSGGQNPTTQIAETISGARAPLKAYVVSGEVSSQMALDRRTSRAATFTGG